MRRPSGRALTVDIDTLAARLETLVGTGAVERGTITGHGDTRDGGPEGWGPDGLQPVLRVAPATEEELGAVLRLIREAGACAAVRGAGTKQHWGLPLRRADVVISTHRLPATVRHEREDLVASAGSGLAWARLQEELARVRQWVPLDPPYAERATVGGVVAAATSGPRRPAYGAVRDLVIGARAVLADGRIIRAGGRVIKNVAGYDLCKLLTGSLGALAVITEVTWKVAPLPETTAAVFGTCADFTAAAGVGQQLRRSLLQPAAALVLWPGSKGSSGMPAPRVRVDVDGTERVVTRQVRELREMLAPLAEDVTVDGPRAVDHPDGLLAAVRSLPDPDPRAAVIRIGVPAGYLPEGFHQAMRELAAHGGRPLAADLMTGLLWWMAEGDSPSLPASVAELDRELAHVGGYATVQSGPAPLRRQVGEHQRRRLALSARIKRVFDPGGHLSPGRFGEEGFGEEDGGEDRR